MDAPWRLFFKGLRVTSPRIIVTSDGAEPAEFVIRYDGPLLDEHRMPVRDLAPALLALGQAFDRANELVNGNRAEVSLEVRATEPGSFDIVLTLFMVVGSAAMPVLTSDWVTAAINLKELFFDNGLLSLIKRLNGRPPEIVDRTVNNVTINIDGNLNMYPLDVLRLYEDRPTRRLVEEVVRPVTRDGIDRVQVRQGNQTIETVEKSDAASFGVQQEADASITTENMLYGQRLRPTNVAFEAGKKWRLNNGTNKLLYSIKDEAFAQDMARGKRIGGEDTLICDVLVRQATPAGGESRTEYEVTRVVEHIMGNPGGDQLGTTSRPTLKPRGGYLRMW